MDLASRIKLSPRVSLFALAITAVAPVNATGLADLSALCSFGVGLRAGAAIGDVDARYFNSYLHIAGVEIGRENESFDDTSLRGHYVGFGYPATPDCFAKNPFTGAEIKHLKFSAHVGHTDSGNYIRTNLDYYFNSRLSIGGSYKHFRDFDRLNGFRFGVRISLW